MSLRRDFDESQYFSDMKVEEEKENIPKRREIKKKLEDRLEQKRLKASFDELDGEFNWDDYK